MDTKLLRQRFAERYGRPGEASVRAPGRVNLIGEHTDYNDGFVLPIAIDRQITACLARRADRTIRLESLQADGAASTNLDEPILPGRPDWANYCLGVAAGLVEAGVELCGVDILFDSDIPLGAGLSSSAALEVCTAMAMLTAAEAPAPPDGQLALLCQRAENEFAGAPCGIMDQSISLMARPGQAMLLDCRSGRTEHVPFDRPNYVLLVVDTRVRHEIGAGEYGRRRDQCASAADKLGVAALRDTDLTAVDVAAKGGSLSEIEANRARHVIGEIARTVSAADALREGDLVRFGQLMYESHASLSDLFEVSCRELDAVVELAGQCEGVLGARMTGGGFGGSAIVLASAVHADAITAAVEHDYQARFGMRCGIFATRAAAGAGPV